MARFTTETEARGDSIMGGCMTTRPDGSVSWVLCPSPGEQPLPDVTPEEAAANMARLLDRARSLPPWTPQIPGWYRGDKPTGRDPEAVRLVAERKRIAEQS